MNPLYISIDKLCRIIVFESRIRLDECILIKNETCHQDICICMPNFVNGPTQSKILNFSGIIMSGLQIFTILWWKYLDILFANMQHVAKTFMIKEIYDFDIKNIYY